MGWETNINKYCSCWETNIDRCTAGVESWSASVSSLINDLPALFADNTNLPVSVATTCEIEEKLETDLNNVHRWLLANKLTLNVQKTEYMFDTEPILSMGSESFKRVLST